eukprot:m.23580 g.23580  ORF g.23580 m.23580 type:complete len:176 (+) comp7517_c0_seq3:315-842(+)
MSAKPKVNKMPDPHNRNAGGPGDKRKRTDEHPTRPPPSGTYYSSSQYSGNSHSSYSSSQSSKAHGTSNDRSSHNNDPQTYVLPPNPTKADKRAHHNALERKRRDNIKDNFNVLRDSIPTIQGEKSSRAQILNKATEYIQYMRKANAAHQSEMEELRAQNEKLAAEASALSTDALN